MSEKHIAATTPVIDPKPKLRDRLTNVGTLRVSNAAGVRAADPRLEAGSMGRELARMGLRRGDRLAVVIPNGPEFVASFLACLQAEITFVPINPAVPEDELALRCRAVGVTGKWIAGEGFHRLAPGRPLPPEGSRIPAVIFFTSGSAGYARPVAVSEQALMHVADTHHRALGYARGDAIVGCLPWSHAFGFTLELLMALLYEGTLRSVPSAEFSDVVQASPGDYLFAVPRIIARLADGPLHRLQGGIVGGAPVRGQIRRRLQASRLRVGYGQTECAPGAALGEAGEWGCDDFLGRPLGCELVLRPGPAEGAGELFLQGPNLAMGYVQGDQLIPVVSADGWRATGDLATQSGDGFVFQGRKDELFKLDNGRMVNPVPLERPYDGRVLLIGEGRKAVQPLVRDETPRAFTLPVPHLQPKVMPEAFWTACTTLTGKVSRQRAQLLFYQK